MRVLSTDRNYGEVGLKTAVGEIIQKIGRNLPDIKPPISMYLAGGVAVNFYTGYRSTTDIDASFSRLILLPKKEDLTVAYLSQTNQIKHIYLDTNYNTNFAVMHPDYEEDSLIVEGAEFQHQNLCLKILNPVDLAVSKIARFVGKDREDIEQLARFQLITAEEVEARTKEALDYYVGNTAMLYLNLSDALNIINQAPVLIVRPDIQPQPEIETIVLSSEELIVETLETDIDLEP